MIAVALGLFGTVKTAIMGSRVLQYALMAAVAVAMVFYYLHKRDARVVAEVMARANAAVAKRVERSREIRRDIKRLPLSERAERLRKLDATG